MNWIDRFSKNTQIKFRENPSSGSRIVSCGQTDGRTGRQRDADKCHEANSPLLLICERA